MNSQQSLVRLSSIMVSLLLAAVALLLTPAWSNRTNAQAREIEPTETVTASAAISGTIAYIGMDSSRNLMTINRIDPDGTDQQTLWTHPSSVPETNTLYDLAWKPDATEIGFSSNHESLYSAFNSDVYGIRPDGSGLRRITNPPSVAELNSGSYQFGTVTGQVYNNYGYVTSFFVYVEGAKDAVSVNVGDYGDTVGFTIPDVADLGVGSHTVTLIWSKGSVSCANGREYTASVVDVVAGQTVDAGTLQFNGQCGTYDSKSITWKRDGSLLGVDVIGPRQFDAAGQALGTDLFSNALFADNLAWSPTDDRILYRKWVVSGSDNGIYMTTAGGSSGTWLVQENAYSLYVTPAWLPDGSGFVVSADNALYYYDFSNPASPLSTILDFGSGGDYILNPSVSPDGNYVVFERYMAATVQSNLWIVERTKPTNLYALTTNGRSANPSWSRVDPPSYKYLYLPYVGKN